MVSSPTMIVATIMAACAASAGAGYSAARLTATTTVALSCPAPVHDSGITPAMRRASRPAHVTIQGKEW